MDKNEEKLRARLAKAKGGHRRKLQARVDALASLTVVAPVPAPVVKKKAAKKTAKKK